MRVMFRNIRGLKRMRAKDKLINLVKHFNPSLLWIAEPKIRTSRNYVKNLRLPGMNQMVIHNAFNGSKANIWLFWHDSISTPNVISTTTQAITVKVGEVLVTGIHAACLTVDRRQLWDELVKIQDMNMPCLIIGDFNVVLSSDEKIGGRRPLRIGMKEFRECLNSCELIQAPKTGIKYSWCNNRVGKKRILCDLDKDFFNVKWLEKFDGWQYKVGTRGTSDHDPIMGKAVEIPKPKNIPFRYQTVWTSHPDFINVIKSSWEESVTGNPAFVFMAKLKRFKEFIKKWNWEVFSDLRVKMTQAEEEVEKAAMVSDTNPENIELLNVLITARRKQEIVAQQFNELLRTKARVKWIISEEDNMFLDAIPSTAEIKEAVYGMDANNSPGPDGFPGSFAYFPGV
ncbi:uncharacterized protein LOC113355121 [Papaver somniferum]|uniref:uncharacterized protein LOC113355121 n=1 Tax=Papaver somniferum TaxID=3469 RepID=UPI000E6F5A8E|nr:uncharacterized protein LOC113355121 [Papaver somniferum]